MIPIARIMIVELLGPESAVTGIAFLPGEKRPFASSANSKTNPAATAVRRHVRVEHCPRALGSPTTLRRARWKGHGEPIEMVRNAYSVILSCIAKQVQQALSV